MLLRTTTVALVGNPNTGKTTLFNALAGMRQRVGNYPGVTVETKKGQMHHQGRSFDLVDLPGTYSLAPRSPDEMVAVDLILGHQTGEPRPDVVLSIVDASNLERNLYLTTQVLELGVPVVIALNMIDVAEKHGTHIDAEKLAKQLGVPVVPIQANKRRGLDALRAELAKATEEENPAPLAAKPAFPDAFEQEVTALNEALGEEVEPFLLRRLLLDVGGYTEQRLENQHADLKTKVEAARKRLAEAGCPIPAVEARTRYGWIRQVTAGCIERPTQRPVTWTDRLDRVLTHKLWGTLIFLAVMFLVFMAIFEWAKPLMKLISGGKEWLADALKEQLPPGALTSLLLEGVLEGVGAVLVFLPQIVILFGFIAILEDCGYMARAAFLMDKLMARCGLSGKSFIPMLSSVACAVPGIMATRVIENRRDRLATILVAPLMSCSARLPVYILLIAAFLTDGYPWWMPGLVMFCMYLIGLVIAPLVALLLKRTLLRGETPVFVMEMPAYKRPSIRLVLRRMYDAGVAFTYRAGTIILASMIVVWALLYFPDKNAAGARYSDLMAAEEAKVKEERKELEALEKEVKDTTRYLAENEKAEHGSAIERLLSFLGIHVREEPLADWEVNDQVRAIRNANRKIKPLKEKLDPVDDRIHEIEAEWKKNSILGRIGQAIEPVVKPLGWDWRIGVAALASFPAREVVVGTLGIICQMGKVDTEELREDINKAREEEKLGEVEMVKKLRDSRWDNEPDRKVYSVPVVLSLMVFFALCCQCASTLAVIRRETNSWRWPAFTFVYMTLLAYVAALVVYQVGSRISG